MFWVHLASSSIDLRSFLMISNVISCSESKYWELYNSSVSWIAGGMSIVEMVEIVKMVEIIVKVVVEVSGMCDKSSCWTM